MKIDGSGETAPAGLNLHFSSDCDTGIGTFVVLIGARPYGMLEQTLNQRSHQDVGSMTALGGPCPSLRVTSPTPYLYVSHHKAAGELIIRRIAPLEPRVSSGRGGRGRA